MQRVSVPGGWVDFREPEDVPERLRRRVTTMASKAGALAAGVTDDTKVGDVSPEDMAFLLEFNDAVALCLIMGWSWSDIPVSLDGIQDLPARAYDAIVQYGQKNISRLMPNFSVDPDPKALTGNSSA